MLRIHCDNPDCEKTVPADRPDFGWRRVESISVISMAGLDDDLHHYCSSKCEHIATGPKAPRA